MHLRFTVVDPGALSDPVDVGVEAAPGSPFGAVRDDLVRVCRESGEVSGGSVPAFFAGSEPVGDGSPLGLPPLVDGAVLTAGPPRTARSRPGLLQLRVVGGPDAGGIHPLPPGRTTIGRDAEAADIRLADHDVSRLHAQLVVGDGVLVRDLGSTNGTLVDGVPVRADGAALLPGVPLRVGQTSLIVATPGELPASLRADGNGGLEINRPPRLAPPAATPEFTYPPEPEKRDPPKLPLIAIVVPLVSGAALFAISRSAAYLLFVLLSPLMLVGNTLSDRFSGRRKEKADRAAYRDARAEVERKIEAAVAADADSRRTAAPDAAQLLATAQAPGHRLWERRPGDADFLSLRAGTGEQPCEVRVRDGSSGEPQQPVATDLPIVISLRDCGVLGVAAPATALEGLARLLMAQVAGWHSPREVDLAVLCAPPERRADWQWASWLPHKRRGRRGDGDETASVVGELATLVEQRTRSGSRSSAKPAKSTVVVMHGARRLRLLPGVTTLLTNGPAHGVFPVCLDEDPLALPAECGATLVIRDGALTLSAAGRPDTIGTAEGVSLSWADRFARALAPLRDATPEDGRVALPGSVRLLDLLPFDATNPSALADAWSSSHSRGPFARIGVAADGPFTIDLRRDGPHALIAGTTGAGKSELLQSLVTSLAAGSPPDELSFVLVDYKGGSAFRECARLPHTAGLVTDLDSHLTERALVSLSAEISRRERLFAAAGCADIADYRRSAPAAAPLPRLVLVIDEFATLVDELPDFVRGLVNIAQRGRSLGLHLILATQRPAGVVSADIRANTNLRIALRMTDAAESQDVLDASDAALISGDTPGRAYARRGGGALSEFQCGRATTSGPSAQQMQRKARVSRIDASAGAPADRHVAVGASAPSDLSRFLEAARSAAGLLGVTAPASPWLPPLPAMVPAEELQDADPELLPLALLDLPAEQRRGVYGLDLARDEHLLVAGGPRSGRSTVLRAVACAAARRAGADVHIYSIDCAGSLGSLEHLTCCGTAVGRDQPARGARLIVRLHEEIVRRQTLLLRAGFSSIGEQHAHHGDEKRLPWLLVLLDSWDGFLSSYESIENGRPIDEFIRLLREGAGAGLRAVVTGDRALLTSRLTAVAGQRLVLRLPDAMDYSLAGVAQSAVPADLPPGRGLVLGPDPASAVEAQVALPVEPAGSVAVPDGLIRVASLPARIRSESIDWVSTGPLTALVGVGGDDLAPAIADFGQTPAFVVSGPPGSGRSTAIATMIRSLAGTGTRVLVLAPRRSPLWAMAGSSPRLDLAPPHSFDRVRDVIEGGPGPLVVAVDDVEFLPEDVESLLCEALRSADDRGSGLLLGGSTIRLQACYSGLAADARRHRTGLLLMPSGALDGDVLGVRVAAVPERVRGRGLLVCSDRVTPVQVAE